MAEPHNLAREAMSPRQKEDFDRLLDNILRLLHGEDLDVVLGVLGLCTMHAMEGYAPDMRAEIRKHWDTTMLETLKKARDLN